MRYGIKRFAEIQKATKDSATMGFALLNDSTKCEDVVECGEGTSESRLPWSFVSMVLGERT